MSYEIINCVSSRYVPKWGNQKKYIAIHYLGVDGQNNQLDPDGCGAHFYIYWDGRIYQRCDLDAIVWAVGTAGTYTQKHPEARNANTISIEMCCHCDGNAKSANDPKWYFTEATQKACVWLVQKLMKDLGIPASHVLRHYDIVNKLCPAPYVHNNKYKGTWTWQEFLTAVSGEPVTDKWYRVRKSWTDEKSQLGAYTLLENAISSCPVGYSVFDGNGNAVYTHVDSVSSAQIRKYPSGVPTSKEAYIESAGAICQKLMQETGVLASVVTAQCCLETGFGLDPSCKVLMDVNNLLGMKVDLINNTWSQWTVWSGKSIIKQTPEVYNGKTVMINDSFRCYADYEECIRDYVMFLLHVRNSKGYKYSRLKGLTDPASVIRIIRIGTGTVSKPEGYCTDPAYETKILRIISENNLTRFDVGTNPVNPAQNPTVTADKYVVRKSWTDAKSQTNSFNNLDYAKKEADRYGYTVFDASTGQAVYTPIKDRYAVRHNLDDKKYQLGLFSVLDNAKKVADTNWGYKVFDITDNSTVYAPKLTAAQKLVAECVYMDLIVRDDIKGGKVWTYKNKNTKKLSKTFDKARSDYNFKTNCSTAVYWALLRSGAVNSNRDGIQWNGNGGFVWLNPHAKADALKYFNLLTVNKSMKKCIEDGTVQPGDVISFVNLSHTCIYIAHGMTFDTGHHNCSGSGEGAKFVQWISAAGYMNYRVAEILRPK